MPQKVIPFKAGIDPALAEVLDVRDSMGLRLNDKRKPIGCLENVVKILQAVEEWENVLAYNQFSLALEKKSPPPFDYLTPTSMDQFGGFLWGMLWIFLMSGINNAATFRQYPIVFAYSPAKGAQMLGWTGAWAAFGPFVWNSLIATSIDKTGTVNAFFIGTAVFYVYSLFVNWYYYTRNGAERFDYGNAGGTWWDKLSDSEKDRMKRVDLGQAA